MGEGASAYLKSARVQMALIAAAIFVLLFTLDRLVVDAYRRPVSAGGKNVYLTTTPSPCFVEALGKHMASQKPLGYSCALATPPWGYWGPPPATCTKIGTMPPSCSSIGITHVPCPFDLPATGPPVKTTDECGNPICTPTQVYNATTGQNQTQTVCPICVPDCISALSAACSAASGPYSGPPYPCLTEAMTPTQARANIFLYIVQSIYTAMGVGFFIVYGARIKDIKNPMLRNRSVATWLAISYFFISWYPHVELHELYSGGDSWTLFILTETLFHWPMALASAALSYYQIDLMLILLEVHVLKQGYNSYLKKNNIPWYHNYKIQAVIVTLAGYGFWLGIQWGILPLPIGADPGLANWGKSLWSRCWPNGYQQFFLVTFWLVDCFVGATSFGFLILSIMLTRGLKGTPQRHIAIISSGCIFYNLALSGFHSLVHTATAPCIVNIITIDYVVHLTMMATVTVLAYYQWLLLDNAVDPKSVFARGVQARQYKAASGASAGSGASTTSNNAVSSSAAGSGSGSDSVDAYSGQAASISVAEVEMTEQQ